MRRVILGVVCAVMLAGSVPLGAQDGYRERDRREDRQSSRTGRQNFTLVNRTGLQIQEVYVSASESDEWGNDVLGRGQLASGNKVNITFQRRTRACVWDIKVVDDDENEFVWKELNLCEASEITLRFRGRRPVATIK